MRRAVPGLFGTALLCWTPPALAQDGAAAGQTPFRQRCGACHQIETARNGVGPHLQRLVGRSAGSVAGVNFSPALKASGIAWTPETLDVYLANPTSLVRGTRMTQRFGNADERRAIIEFVTTR